MNIQGSSAGLSAHLRETRNQRAAGSSRRGAGLAAKLLAIAGACMTLHVFLQVV